MDAESGDTSAIHRSSVKILREPKYGTDITNAEWQAIEPLLSSWSFDFLIEGTEKKPMMQTDELLSDKQKS